VGMAPGNTMMENFLSVRGLLPEPKSLTDIYVVVIDGAFDAANLVARKLREVGINTEVDITTRKIDKQLKTAFKKKIPYLLFVGSNDSEAGEYSLKNVATEEEMKLSLADIIAKFAR